jgi:hypothetical protein
MLVDDAGSQQQAKGIEQIAKSHHAEEGCYAEKSTARPRHWMRSR